MNCRYIVRVCFKVWSIETWAPLLLPISIIKVSNISFERTQRKGHFRLAQIEEEVEATFNTPHLQISRCALCNVTLFWYMREIRNVCCCEYLLRCVFVVRESEFVSQTIAKRLPGQWLASNSKRLLHSHFVDPCTPQKQWPCGDIRKSSIASTTEHFAYSRLQVRQIQIRLSFVLFFSVFKRIEIWMSDFLLRPQNTNINSAILVIFTFIGMQKKKKKCKNTVCEVALAARGECSSMHWLATGAHRIYIFDCYRRSAYICATTH